MHHRAVNEHSRISQCQEKAQGVRESAGVPQFVMLCRRWAQLQCFAGRTGRTAGCCVAGKRAQYRKIRPFPKNLRSQILDLSPYSLHCTINGQSQFTAARSDTNILKS